jgi:hypothetical protein
MKGTYSICDYCGSALARHVCMLCNKDICESHTSGVSLNINPDHTTFGFTTVGYSSDYLICRHCQTTINNNIIELEKKLSTYNNKKSEEIKKIRVEILNKIYKIFKEEYEVLNL